MPSRRKCVASDRHMSIFPRWANRSTTGGGRAIRPAPLFTHDKGKDRQDCLSSTDLRSHLALEMCLIATTGGGQAILSVPLFYARQDRTGRIACPPLICETSRSGNAASRYDRWRTGNLACPAFT